VSLTLRLQVELGLTVVVPEPPSARSSTADESFQFYGNRSVFPILEAITISATLGNPQA